MSLQQAATVRSRTKVAESIFAALAQGINGHRRIDSQAMRYFALLNGFDGSASEWEEEFIDLCRYKGCLPSEGLSEANFLELLSDDSTDGLYMSTEELQSVNTTLLDRKPNLPLSRTFTKPSPPPQDLEVNSRRASKAYLFRALTSGKGNVLDASMLHKFAVLCGFRGSDEAWRDEFREVCEAWDIHDGLLSESTFNDLLEDTSEFGMFMDDRELASIAAQLCKNTGPSTIPVTKPALRQPSAHRANARCALPVTGRPHSAVERLWSPATASYSSKAPADTARSCNGVAEDPQRTDIQLAVFAILDLQGRGRLGSREMHTFADLCGFQGSDAEWQTEWDLICLQQRVEPARGFSLKRFISLVEDKSERGFFTSTEELRAIYRHLRCALKRAIRKQNNTTENDLEAYGKYPVQHGFHSQGTPDYRRDPQGRPHHEFHPDRDFPSLGEQPAQQHIRGKFKGPRVDTRSHRRAANHDVSDEDVLDISTAETPSRGPSRCLLQGGQQRSIADNGVARQNAEDGRRTSRVKAAGPTLDEAKLVQVVEDFKPKDVGDNEEDEEWDEDEIDIFLSICSNCGRSRMSNINFDGFDFLCGYIGAVCAGTGSSGMSDAAAAISAASGSAASSSAVAISAASSSGASNSAASSSAASSSTASCSYGQAPAKLYLAEEDFEDSDKVWIIGRQEKKRLLEDFGIADTSREPTEEFELQMQTRSSEGVAEERQPARARPFRLPRNRDDQIITMQGSERIVLERKSGASPMQTICVVGTNKKRAQAGRLGMGLNKSSKEEREMRTLSKKSVQMIKVNGKARVTTRFQADSLRDQLVSEGFALKKHPKK